MKVLNLSDVYFHHINYPEMAQTTETIAAVVVVRGIIKKRRTSPTRLNRVFRSPDCAFLCSALPGIPIGNSKLMRTNFSVHTSVIQPLTVLCLSARLDNVNEPAREWYNLFTICCYFFCNTSSLSRRNNLISIICRQTVRY